LRALGIDVGVTKGLDLVVLDDDLIPRQAWRRVGLGQLGGLIQEVSPDVVAIDSPPGWARSGRSRKAERDLRALGIQSFGTPTRRRATGNAFYTWMRRGFRAFRIAETRGYRRYGSGSPRRSAVEVFPHATAVVLAGCLPPAGSDKRRWRTRVLRSRRVEVTALGSVDQVDAALAALTGLEAARGRATAVGDAAEGVIVLPALELPSRPYRRCRRSASPDPQRRLPGMSPCTCGDPACSEMTAREFARGHDAKRKSALWKAARAGHDAADELRRRGWELPPEMR
jgi:predicted nuclease with RNAse H fold